LGTDRSDLQLPNINQKEEAMGVASLDTEIKDLLMNTNEEFKRLALQHHSYSQKLEQLSSQHFLTEAEKLEEVQLKKKKLLLKDQMHAMISQYRKEMKQVHSPKS
jgi:uncharacterized protein YdcH (DUF465 family)